MKRTLFAVFLAVMLVAALVFITAPEAKAATILTPADATDGKITISSAGQILDLQGANLTVVFAEDVELSVIDTTIKQEKDGTNNAGTLTVEGAGSIAAVSVDPTSRMRFLAIATDGVYSAYPFNLAISQAGINTIAKNPDDKTLEEPATCIRASFMAFKPVIDEIDAYGFIVNGNKYAATKTFTTNITHAYADLQGTLRESIIDNPVSIQAYMTINEKDYVSSAVTVIPREVLKTINKENVQPTAAQKERLMALIGNNTRVANILTNMQTTTKDEIVTSTLTFAEGNRVASSGTQQTWQQNGVTLIYDKGSYNQSLAEYANPARFYAGTKLTVNMTGITQIVFDCNSSSYATALESSIGTVSGATVSVSSDKVTVTFTNAVDSFAVANLTAQVRMDSMTVTATKTITNIVTCKHGTNLSEATCSKQAVCIDCDQPYGETSEHSTVAEATCTEKAQCSVCGEYGEALGHDDTEVATCHSAAVCTRCGKHGDYDANNHTAYVKPTCTKLGYCTDCEADGLGELASHNYENGECTACGEKDPNANKVQLLATFALGANGSAAHYDGSSKTSYSETNNGYTLSITGGTNMYTGARDAKGNSCIKLGASSKAGSFKFTVPENVTEVVIYIAKYKANTTKISVNNGASQTLTKSSNDGAYDVITIDTTTNKTIALTTQSGGIRAMVNTIEFIG